MIDTKAKESERAEEAAKTAVGILKDFKDREKYGEESLYSAFFILCQNY